MTAFVLPFTEIDRSSLPFVGGKGANLGELTQAGFPVPPGFCVTTAAYKTLLETSDEMNDLLLKLEQIPADGLDDIRRFGQRIRHHLSLLPIPPEVETAIVEAWRQNGAAKAYAVRSSATAEDLPGASFAGQQETYLNVLGEQSLLDAVRHCIASLFTDRAIFYRAAHGFSHRQVLLSVVVQEMVVPDVSGIMFTADPISGNRNITSIDASFGLGEALVSGLVSADLYQTRDGSIIHKKISRKQCAIYGDPKGGTLTKPLTDQLQQAQALPDNRILQLAALGRTIERHYGAPQDIEWCLADDTFFIVQSRPITSLYPVPACPDSKLHIFVSMGHIQMMTNAMKPLATSIFPILAPNAVVAGGRVYGDFTNIFGIKAVRKRFLRVARRMDEQLASALEEVLQRPEVKPRRTRIPLRKAAPIAWSVAKIVVNNVFFVNPIRQRAVVNRYIADAVEKCRQAVLSDSAANSRLGAVQRHIHNELVPSLLKVAPNWASSELVWTIIEKLLYRWLGDVEDTYKLQRSLPGNVTSELGLMIGDLADLVRDNAPLMAYLQRCDNQTFYEGLQGVPSSAAFRKKFAEFMHQFGMRCPGEIDISKPRWHEVPATLAPAILSHVRTVSPGEHRVHFANAAAEADEFANNLVSRVHTQKGAVRAKILRRLLCVYRNLGGLREHHKYLLVQYFDIYRQAILQVSSQLAELGVLQDASDASYLTLQELQALETRTMLQDVRPLIAERRGEYQIHQALTPPRVMTSEGEIITGIKKTANSPDGTLAGTPVSAGIVEGFARVVRNPEDAELSPGEIIIAPFTDPGWTPLFHSAKAIVMEVGGLMTHGAVIAREYGIPAVAGVDNATQMIQDGTYIRVDGTKGYVEILSGPAPLKAHGQLMPLEKR